MKKLQSIVSAFVIALLQFSVCTGGIASASLVFLSSFSVQSNDVIFGMSTESMQSLLCTMASSASSAQSNATDVYGTIKIHSDPQTCTHGKACIQNAASNKNEKTILAYVPVAVFTNTFEHPTSTTPESNSIDYTNSTRTISYLKQTMVQIE